MNCEAGIKLSFYMILYSSPSSTAIQMIKYPDGTVFALCKVKNSHLYTLYMNQISHVFHKKKYSTIFIILKYVQELVVLEKISK